MTTGEMFGFAAVLLLAVLVGAAVPVLYQAARALRSLRVLLDDAGPGLQQALRETTRAAETVRRLAAGIEEEGRRLRPAADAVAGVGRALADMGASARRAGAVLGALGPPLLAALRSFFGRDPDEDAAGVADPGNGDATEAPADRMGRGAPVGDPAEGGGTTEGAASARVRGSAAKEARHE